MRLLASLALCLLLAPLAGACPATYVTAQSPGGPVLYVGDDGTLWQESNGVRGLQCAWFLVAGRAYAPDTRVSP
jgi:hypothetical protein